MVDRERGISGSERSYVSLVAVDGEYLGTRIFQKRQFALRAPLCSKREKSPMQSQDGSETLMASTGTNGSKLEINSYQVLVLEESIVVPCDAKGIVIGITGRSV